MNQQMFSNDTNHYYHIPNFYTPSFAQAPSHSFALPWRPADAGLADIVPKRTRQHHQHQTLSPFHLQYPQYTRFQQPFHPRSNFAMANPQTDDDLAEFQELSNRYQPEVTGPLLGARQPSSNITAEYDAADPVYRVKTTALARKYASYRTCRGDGRCGWRAIAFGYFDCLFRLADPNKLRHEEARLKSLRNTVTAAGFDQDILEGFEEVALDLLRDIAPHIGTLEAENKLVEAFNDEGIQNFIITYFRMLTAAWIQTRPENFAPFVAPLTVVEYCNQSIMTHDSELADVGINAIADILLKPAGLSLEIIYLDRSDGDEANVHHYGPMTAALASIRLLYRPGHYDLLYKAEDTVKAPAIAPTPVSVPAYQAAYPTTFFEENDSFVEDAFAGMPFASLANHDPESFGASLMPALNYGSIAVPALPPIPSFPGSYSLPNVFEPLQHEEFDFGNQCMPSLPVSSSLPMNASPDVFRPSRHMYDQKLLQMPAAVPDQEFQSAQFRKCHFLNSNFEPEAWDPSTVYITAPTYTRVRRRRNS